MRGIIRVVDLQGIAPGQRVFPLVNLGMSVCEGKPAGAIVVRRWSINPGPGWVRIEQTGVVDAVRVFVGKDPSLSCRRVSKLAHLSDVLVARGTGAWGASVPWATFGVAIPDADIT